VSGSGSRRCHGPGRTLAAMLTRRAAVVGVAAAALLAVTACQPLDTGASGSHSTVKSAKTTKKSGKAVVRLETKKGSTTTSRQSVTVRSGSVARVTSTGNGRVSCRIVFNGRTLASKTGTGAVTCSATVTH
jgi:hypothetical protein